MSSQVRTSVLWLSAACGAILIVSFLLPLGVLPDLDLCWFKAVTHLPCPGCGLTRSFLCISHGEWGRAWAFNPFGFLWYALCCYGSLRPLFLRSSRLAGPTEKVLGSKFFFLGIALAMTALWGWELRAFLS